MTASPGREPRRWPLVIALVVVAGLAVALFATSRSAEPTAEPAVGPTICGTTPDPPPGGDSSQFTSNGVDYNRYTFEADGALTPTQSVNADFVLGADSGQAATSVSLTAGTTYRVIAGVSIAAADASDAATGGRGSVVVRWPRFCMNISQPTSPKLAGSVLTWAAPAYVPSGQSVASYTVIYKSTADDIAGKIYARSTSATPTSIDIGGRTSPQCAVANPSGWTCNPDIDLASGQSYEFQVFARSLTSAAAGQLTEAFPYAES